MSNASLTPPRKAAVPAQALADAALAAQGLPGDDAAEAMVSLYQQQKKIYARAVSGLFATWRWSLVWLTQLLFYGAPWLSLNQRQAVLFDVGTRRFYIGPLVLYPQDFIYLTAILIISAYALFLFTAVAGRLWCGFAFVGYFTPIKSLAASAAQLGLGPWEWFWVLFYGLATYGNAGFLCEQVCKYICPYARFQSAMFDKDTLIISYDTERGEPRGSRSRKADPAKLGLGSCIACGLCVQVCPTGIDIRQGLQYECIGCAACIDVCDGVMDKMQYPRGLIRYDTQNGLAQHLSRSQRLARIFRPQVLVYTTILGGVLLALLASLVMRSPFKVDGVRDRAALARLVDDGQIENIYRLQVMNATESPQRYRLAVAGLAGLTMAAVPTVELAAAEARWVTVAVRLPPASARQLGPGAHAMHFEISLLGTDGAGRETAPVTLSEKSTFVVPR